MRKRDQAAAAVHDEVEADMASGKGIKAGIMAISGGVTLVSSSNTMKEVPIDYPEVCECVITGGTIAASGGYGKNTQAFSRAENQACLLLKWKDEQPAREAVTLKSEENVILTAIPRAPFKTLIVSTPALKEGQRITVWQSDAAVCQRVISGSLMQFPVTPSKNTKASRRGENGAAATEPPAKAPASGSMTAHPASSVDFISKLRAVNPRARITILDHAEHKDVPSRAWLDEELGLLSWMLAQ